MSDNEQRKFKVGDKVRVRDCEYGAETGRAGLTGEVKMFLRGAYSIEFEIPDEHWNFLNVFTVSELEPAESDTVAELRAQIATLTRERDAAREENDMLKAIRLNGFRDGQHVKILDCHAARQFGRVGMSGVIVCRAEHTATEMYFVRFETPDAGVVRPVDEGDFVDLFFAKDIESVIGNDNTEAQS